MSSPPHAFLPFGLIVGTGIGWLFWFKSRCQANRLDEEKQLLAQEKVIVLDFMHSLAEAIGEGVDRPELCRRVVHAAVRCTGAQSASIFIRNGDQLRSVAAEGLFPPLKPLDPELRGRLVSRTKFLEQVLRSEVHAAGEGLVGTVAVGAEGLMIEDAAHDPRVVSHDDASLKINSLILVPIRFRERSLGVLAIVNPTDGGGFGESDHSLAMSLGEQTALALQNLDLMEMQIIKNRMDVDLALASNIQGMLLPKRFPENPAVQIAAIYQPAQKVGGDLYDVISLPDGRIGVAIADVSGKGVPASILMALCQGNLRHLARECASPAQVLSRLNGVMDDEMRQDMFVTMIYAVIDTVKGEITLARAGHELPLVVSGPEGQASARFLQSEGMALGMVPEAFFSEVVQEVTLAFQPGDVLVLYTDGITETANAEGTEFSKERLADTIRSLRSKPVEEIHIGLLMRLKEFTGGQSPRDDLTLLTVKRL